MSHSYAKIGVLEKDTRTGQDAKLTIANRDTEGFCFKLRFDIEHCKWGFVCNDNQRPEKKPDENAEWLLLLVDELLDDTWSGTATELCDALKTIDPEADLAPRIITKRLKGSIGLFKKNNIEINLDRNRDTRTITFTRQE